MSILCTKWFVSIFVLIKKKQKEEEKLLTTKPGERKGVKHYNIQQWRSTPVGPKRQNSRPVRRRKTVTYISHGLCSCCCQTRVMPLALGVCHCPLLSSLCRAGTLCLLGFVDFMALILLLHCLFIILAFGFFV